MIELAFPWALLLLPALRFPDRPRGAEGHCRQAHRVAPLTEDPEVLKPFLEGLSPEVMPGQGQKVTAALDLARAALAAEEVPGATLFVLDDLGRADLPAFERHAAENGPGIVFLYVGGSGAALDDISRILGAAVVRVTPDAADIAEIDRWVASAYRDALARDERQKWDDRGWFWSGRRHC